MKKIAVMGAPGRMGQEIAGVLASSADFEMVAGAGQSSSEFPSSPSEWDPNQIDAVIDFSLPDGFDLALQWCQENKKAFVSGTTGLTDTHFDKMNAASKVAPILWSPNMSLGVTVLRKALSAFSNARWFDFAIEELHHNKKVDRPSGTALHLKKALEHKTEKTVEEMSSIRGGGIYGVHSVFAMSEDEVLEFKHSALNRKVFASGAVRAMEWLIQQQPGFYTLDDVISDKSGAN